MAGRRRPDRSLRAKEASRGRSGVARREDRRRFWVLIAAGQSSETAAMDVGVSQAVGTRWFREAGGMPPSTLAPSSKPLSGRYLSFADRKEIAVCRAQGLGVREIARRLGRAPSTISRELRRNAATRSGGLEYRADGAMARGARGSAAEGSEAGDERGAAEVCSGSPGRRGRCAWWDDGCRALGCVEGAAAWAAVSSALGEGLEPATDRRTAAPGLPGRRCDAD
jgi:transposase